jgi:hydrogenase/urease accessory protein HupE
VDVLLVVLVAVFGSILLRATIPTAAIALAVTVLGFAHGAAHGGETQATAAVAWGLVTGTAILVGAGAALGAVLERLRGRDLVRTAGFAMIAAALVVPLL